MPITLPDLPYDRNALAPHISAETLDFHHGKHHRAYVDKTNELAAEAGLDDAPLDEIVRAAAKDAERRELFNNAAQAWNHDFYWKSMKPGGGGPPTGEMAAHLRRSLGGYDDFRAAFFEAAKTQFASGWAWLVLHQSRLEIRKTDDAQTPLTERGVTPLLTIDVWEHAYYLDVRNERPKYIEAFLDHLVNWDFALANLRE